MSKNTTSYCRNLAQANALDKAVKTDDALLNYNRWLRDRLLRYNLNRRRYNLGPRLGSGVRYNLGSGLGSGGGIRYNLGSSGTRFNLGSGLGTGLGSSGTSFNIDSGLGSGSGGVRYNLGSDGGYNLGGNRYNFDGSDLGYSHCSFQSYQIVV